MAGPSCTGSAPASPTSSAGWPASAADRALVAGIAAYRRHPYRRDLSDPSTLWREGGTRLLDYGRPGDPALLVVPSLVNRAYVLDLMPGRSFLRFLAGHGIRPLLLDWGWPDGAALGFGLDDYVAGRLDRALTHATAAAGRVALAGYCMGGLLAVATAQRRGADLRGLMLLATPWDFHGPADAPAAGDAHAAPRRLAASLGPVIDATGTLPIDALQALFNAAAPGAVARKYRAFAQLDRDDPRAVGFVALEDWLNDGVPLAGRTARECLDSWYGRNLPMRGLWCVERRPVDPSALRLPAQVFVPSHDRIVPPHSALALARMLPGARLCRPGAGHVGMVAGSRAEAALWRPALDWLRGLPPD